MTNTELVHPPFIPSLEFIDRNDGAHGDSKGRPGELAGTVRTHHSIPIRHQEPVVNLRTKLTGIAILVVYHHTQLSRKDRDRV